MKIKIVLLGAGMLLPICGSAGDWSKEQMEVIKFEEACISSKNADDLIGCFHDDFDGWGLGSTVTTSKADRTKIIADWFANNETELLFFKPVSVIVYGDMAVVSYVTSTKSTDNNTKEVEYTQERWTDVCLKDDGKWYWISDHGVDITSD